MSKTKINQLKKLVSINLSSIFALSILMNVKAEQLLKEAPSSIGVSYLDSRDELKDYILDTGDILNIDFINAPELSGLFSIDQEGEIYFERIKKAYVRGLTINELTELLEKKYKEFLIDPEIYIIINTFKPIRVAVTGEVRKPGLIIFDAISSFEKYLLNDQSEKLGTISPNETIDSGSNFIKKSSDFVSSVSNAIIKSGGLTSYSNISRIEIVRDIPIGSGGGKKKAIIDLTSYLEGSESDMNVRLYDGDSIHIPKLKETDPNLVPNSILAGLSPAFITVNITGLIKNPGKAIIPSEGSLSDVINLNGPLSPLSGKVYLIRYNKNGTILRKNIKYSSTASPGSLQNPYLLENDLISVKRNFFSKSFGQIKAITEPFVGIYATKELYDSFTGN